MHSPAFTPLRGIDRAPVLSTVAAGAEATLSPIGNRETGYFNGLYAARADSQAYDTAARRRLRDLSDSLIAERLS
ncbi:hypothetical protein [Nonomuraea dietziae]|uniref:hypothetical protein n=1 Tax=Nonomuraea dietziae TaxID=65515 RepID=UPI0033CE199D